MEGDGADLKLQFQQLQEQQQLKLLERRKRKEKKNDKNEKQDKNSKPNSAVLKTDDDLNLQLADHSSQGYGYVSEELVDHLNDQIRQLKDENGRLYKLLNEKDFEIRHMKKKKDEQTSHGIDLNVTSETAATKIVELSKKIRELTSEKESEKTRCKQFQKKCHDLQLQLQSQNASGLDNQSMMGSMISLRSAASTTVSDSNKEEDGVDVKALQDRLKQSESRLTDFRNQCQQLRKEIQIANKVLSQEIGENVNIQSLLNETSQWRGRAQQIIALQQKVEELKVRYEGPPTDMPGMDKVTTARRRQEDKYREELKRAEKDRKDAQEGMVTKLKQLEEEHSQIKNKLDASKTRNKVLSNELKGQKAQVQTLLRKSQNDDEFIEALMKQQKQLKELMDQSTSKQSEQQQVQQNQLLQMNMKSQQDSNVVEQLKMIAAQKEAQVKMLEMELNQLRSAHASAHGKNTAWTSNEASSETPLGDEELQSVGSPTVTPPPISSRTEVLSRASCNKNNARDHRTTTPSNNQRAATPLNAISQKEMGELRYQLHELTVMSKALEVERDKMSELVQVLQNRMTDEVERHSKTQQELQNQKRTGTELEKLLGRKNMEAIKLRGVDTKGLESGRLNEEEEDSDEEAVNSTKAELVTSLQIQKDEIQSLKLSLSRSMRAKEEDLKVYSKTLDETKQVFLQALRQMKDKQISALV